MSRFSFDFLRRRKAPSRAPASLPSGLRVYAIGDVHGRLDCMLMLEPAIRRDLIKRPPQGDAIVIFLGDYIDRGPDSSGIINVLRHRRFAGLPARFLLGNHEDAMLRFLEDAKIGPAWFAHGGMATLASYSVKPAGESRESRDEQLRQGLIEALPAAHLAFLESLELWIELGGYLFVHAGIRPGKPIEQQRREDLLMIRDPFFAGINLRWRVVHGHTVIEKPLLTRDRISIDTGAYATGNLTCVVIEGESAEILVS
ncbi:metallophosphoesterase [Sphingomonas montanisoli]|uniref:Serine/threonine protein phosphatase n=1 Tax=Sphingomonas montanisoli TaxID=2606412 RepID=A0A5D9C6U3_9SPHN|nr:metallophosphoesterase [Sphingomonas montanisoli]TZG27568.1 serine/threonine protein phosphatase [Sphingomonas montanisoli]